MRVSWWRSRLRCLSRMSGRCCEIDTQLAAIAVKDFSDLRGISIYKEGAHSTFADLRAAHQRDKETDKHCVHMFAENADSDHCA